MQRKYQFIMGSADEGGDCENGPSREYASPRTIPTGLVLLAAGGRESLDAATFRSMFRRIATSPLALDRVAAGQLKEPASTEAAGMYNR